jgi:hypothetical protein
MAPTADACLTRSAFTTPLTVDNRVSLWVSYPVVTLVERSSTSPLRTGFR